MMSQVDGDIELPEAPAEFGSVMGRTAVPSLPLPTSCRAPLRDGGQVGTLVDYADAVRWGNLGNDNGGRGVFDVCMRNGAKKQNKKNNPPLMPDDTAHLFFFQISETLIPTDIPQLGVWAGTYCHGDPG